MNKKAAYEFWRDVYGTFGDEYPYAGGVADAEFICERMKINEDRFNEYIDATLRYGLNERQGGGWCV